MKLASNILQLKLGFGSKFSLQCVHLLHPRPLGGRAHLASELPEVRRYPTGDQLKENSKKKKRKKHEKKGERSFCFSKAKHSHHHSTEDGSQEGMTGGFNVLMIATKNYRQLQNSAPSPQVNFEVE